MKNKAKFIKDIETNPKYDVLGHQKPKTLERLKQEMADLSSENLRNKSDIGRINKSLSHLNDKEKALKFEHENVMSQKPKALGKHLLAVGGTGAVGLGGYKAIENKLDDR